MTVALTSTAMQLLGACAVFLAGIVVSMRLGASFETSNRRSLCLYLWHTLFCVVYFYYVLAASGDALTYYRHSFADDVTFALGTEAVEFITSIFSTGMGMSLFGVFLVFNIIGYVGLLAFDASLQFATAGRSARIRHAATIIVLLPSVSFWSAAIGKDALAFMAAGLCLWASLDLRKRAGFMATAVLLMLVVRPHVAAIMIIAIAASMALERRVSIAQRALVAAIAIAAAIQLVPFALNYSGLGEANDAASVSDYIATRQGYNMTGGGSIDISTMPLPAKLFTYLFRPLPYEAHSIPSFAASIDNIVLLALVLVGARSGFRNWRRKKPGNRSLLWIYSIATWLSLASTTANLGISMRQKWMFAPMLIFLLITMIGRSQSVKAMDPVVGPDQRLQS